MKLIHYLLSPLVITLALGCHQKKDENSDQSVSYLTNKKIYNHADAVKLTAIKKHARSTQTISKADLDWLMRSVEKCSSGEKACRSRYTFVLSSIYKVSDFSSFPESYRLRLFEAGKQLIAMSKGEEIMMLNEAFLYIEKSGDKRGVALAEPYLHHPHWSVRSVAARCHRKSRAK